SSKGYGGADALLPDKTVGEGRARAVKDLDQNSSSGDCHADGGQSSGVGGEIVVKAHRNCPGEGNRQCGQDRHLACHYEAAVMGA
ncbi:hypothetical protein ACCT32_36320, partial [Rhizobium brockwellii]|uniref:hypothetical protein n=1 Tax=Rhizobium brockwellii TaxID=3019932 RepID=UPI003F9C119F